MIYACWPAKSKVKGRCISIKKFKFIFSSHFWFGIKQVLHFMIFGQAVPSANTLQSNSII